MNFIYQRLFWQEISLDFTGFELAEPKYDEYYAKDNKLSYESATEVRVRLKNLIWN